MKTIVLAADLHDGAEYLESEGLDRATTLVATPLSALRLRGFTADEVRVMPRFADDPRRALLESEAIPCTAWRER